MSAAIETLTSASMALALGLSQKEWNHLIQVLGREPSVEELQMISVMWSEHCSYKSSKRFLKKLKTSSRHVLQGPGENAGLINLDADRAIAFKIESHNHPSFVEPFQGAATGVGGILRDIFTMGARPIALGNYLRFGDLRQVLHQHLFEGVISGIAHYGNCMGIPVVGGHIGSHSCYDGNILVNVFALGLVDKKKIFKSNTAKSGQSIMVWGARTGRDGIHGASLLASADFDQASSEHKIRVQVGDPFKEKTLMEACLEAMNSFASDLTAIQDMGAAGLTSSTTEMASKSNIGMNIDLGKVPVREKEMKAWELLLSESQERMLAIVSKGSESKFKALLEKWGCLGEVIGETTDDLRLRMSYHGSEVVNLPIQDLMDPPEADLPEPQWERPEISVQSHLDIRGESEILMKLLSHPRVCSKEGVFEQYDTTVGNATVFGPGHEAAVLWTPGRENPHLGIAFKGVAEEDWAAIDPKRAASIAMAKAARGLVCVGAIPQAYTDGMNVGTPKDPKTQAALALTVEGFNEFCEAFDTPCISGNVSMHNQTQRGTEAVQIHPTNFVVMVGIVNDVRKAVPSVFQRAGSEVWILEAIAVESNEEPRGSLYHRLIWGEPGIPEFSIPGEKKIHETLRACHELNLLLSCRDIGAGGLAVSLAKACFVEGKLWGFDGDLSKTRARRDYLLFSEAQGRVMVEILPQNRAQLMKTAESFGLQARKVGTVSDKPSFCLRPTLVTETKKLYEAWIHA